MQNILLCNYSFGCLYNKDIYASIAKKRNSNHPFAMLMCLEKESLEIRLSLLKCLGALIHAKETAWHIIQKRSNSLKYSKYILELKWTQEIVWELCNLHHQMHHDVYNETLKEILRRLNTLMAVIDIFFNHNGFILLLEYSKTARQRESEMQMKLYSFKFP